MPNSLPGNVQQSLHAASHSMSVGAVVALVLVALLLLRSIVRRPKRRKGVAADGEIAEGKAAKKRGRRLVRRLVRWAGANLGFALVYPFGSRLGNRRVEVIDGAFGVMTSAIDQAGHRRSRAVCLPGLIRARWIVKCDGCGQFFAFREARSLVNSDEHSLKILSGLTMTERGQVRAQACKARFVEGKPARQPVTAVQNLTVRAAQPVSTSSMAVGQVTQVSVLPKQQQTG